MHSANVIHRDIKPSNLLLVRFSLLRIKLVICKFVILDLPEDMSNNNNKKPNMLSPDGIEPLKSY